MNTNDETIKALSNCVNVLQELTQKLEQAQEPEKTKDTSLPPPELVKGMRRLEVGEEIREGDMFINRYGSIQHVFTYGMPLNGEHLAHYRKIEEDPKPWTPPEGEWFNTPTGAPMKCSGSTFRCENGNAFTSEEEAGEQAELTKGFQWLCALARELNPSGRCMKPSEEGCAVFWDQDGGHFEASHFARGIDFVFEDEEAAQAAIKIMNRDKDRWKEILG